MTKIPNRLHKYVPSMLLFLLFESSGSYAVAHKGQFFLSAEFQLHRSLPWAWNSTIYRRETVCPAFRPVGGGQLYVAVPWRDFP